MKVLRKRENQASDFSIADTFDSQVIGPSDSLSLPSEPPDLGNWFSSYVYESPALDTDNDFGDGHLFKESESEKDNSGIEEINREKEENLGNTRIIQGKNELGFGEKIASDESVECNISTGDKQHENHSVRKGNQWVNVEKDPPFRNDKHFGKISEHKVGGNATQKCNHSSIQNVEGSSWEGKHSEDTLMSLDINKFSGKIDRENLKAQKFQMVESVQPTGIRNNKENEGKYFQSNGFVSTRTARQIDENSVQRMKFESLKIVETVPSGGGKGEGIVKRKALSEMTNFHCSDGMEIAGKWRCPQKSKPDSGPVLKQLRLEQWIRRV